MSGTNQSKGSSPINMDAKTLLRTINNGAQAKIKFFEGLVRKIGEQASKDYRLVTLNQNTLVFEDHADNTHYLADINKSGGSVSRVEIDNIRSIIVKEDKKSADFDKNVAALVDWISEDNTGNADKVFKLIERQRFRSTVIPESGVVTTRDGVTRKIKLQSAVLGEDSYDRIRAAFTKAVSDDVQIAEGKVVKGVFIEGDIPFTIPITEMTRRRMVARMMKEAAETAYKSPTFCNMVGELAGLVCEGKLEDAVTIAADFFKREQEFTLLTIGETKELMENALACSGNFNQELASDLAKVVYRTNIRVNREEILEQWMLAAQRSEEAAVLSEIKDLERTKTFMEDYGKFIQGVFNESSDIRDTRSRAYLASLKIIQSVLSRIEGEEQQADDVQQMIDALEAGNLDDDAIMQAEALLAGISDSIINATRNIENFDQSELGEIDASEMEEDPGEVMPLPDMGGIDGFDAPDGMEPEMAGAGAEAMPAPGMPESTDKQFTPIEEMTSRELLEELEGWKTHGHVFLEEDGFDDIKGQFERYIKRCMNLGTPGEHLLEEFEKIRDNLIHHGDVVSESEENDPYAKSFASRFDSRINDEYRGFAESTENMDAPKGKGVANKSVSTTDGGGSAGGSAAGKGAAAASTGGMSELQGSGGLQAKGVKKSEHLEKQPDKYADVGGGHSQDGKSVAEGNAALDTDLQGSGGVMDRSNSEISGRDGHNSSGSGAAPEGGGKPAINKARGAGVVKKGVSEIDGCSASGTAASGGSAPSNAEPCDGIQDKASAPRGENVSSYVTKGGGVAENKKCDCDCDPCECEELDEAQYKWGTKRQAQDHRGGRGKAKIANEGVQVTISGDDPESGRRVTYEVSDENATADSMIRAIAAELQGDLGGADMMGMDGEAPMDDPMADPMADPMGGEDPMAGDEDPMGGMGEPDGEISDPLDDVGDVDGEEDAMAPVDDLGDGGDVPDMGGGDEGMDLGGDDELGDELGDEAGLDLGGEEGGDGLDLGDESGDEDGLDLGGDDDITDDDLPPMDDGFEDNLGGAFGDEGGESDDDSDDSDDSGESENPFADSDDSNSDSEDSDSDSDDDDSDSDDSDSDDSDSDDSDSDSDDDEEKED